jgi:hypothetical protein
MLKMAEFPRDVYLCAVSPSFVLCYTLIRTDKIYIYTMHIYSFLLLNPIPEYSTLLQSSATRRYKHISLHSGDYKHHRPHFHSSALALGGLQGPNAAAAEQLETQAETNKKGSN